MTPPVIKREQAKCDLIDLAAYIAQDSIDAAERFIDAAETAFKFLAETPGAGAPREYLTPALAGLRMWPIRGFEKHLIFYRQTSHGLEIVRVLHCARDIEGLFDEE